DQAHLLDQLVTLARDSRVEAVIIAGDIYDRAVAPADAVKLLDDVLERLVVGAGIPVIMIAGNHDSPERLGFGSRLLAARGFYVFGPLTLLQPVVLADDHGSVHFCPLPYGDPAEVRLHLGDESLHDHDSAVRALAATMGSRLPAGVRSVAIGHCWVSGGSSSDSERPLSVGGTGQVGADCFAGFHYTALGHLHRPQQVGEGIHYCGSLLKYSFSEAAHRKSVSLVEMDGAGRVRVEPIELSPRRDVRIIEGALKELLQGSGPGQSPEDYLLVRLTDRQAILDAMGKLRRVYPNLLHLERPALQVGMPAGLRGGDHLKRSELELFRAFYQEVAGTELIQGGERALLEVLESLSREG
ncbi:MAG: exonuclease SbcCD subunit D, partial [Candidatus Competibacteraceae bacterium]|nr:exonuclease SbcCD subunit D [Candidatus Competibacteraceae bacterium]